MATLRANLRFVTMATIATCAALATVAHGCSSSSDQTGGPLGNPDCDGGTCDDTSVPLDTSTPDVQFDVDTTPPDTKGGEAPPADAPTEGASETSSG
jgi:hypothetical protein